MMNLVLLPVLLPLLGAAVAMLLYRVPRVQVAWACATLLVACGASLLLLRTVVLTGQPVVFEFGGWPAPFGIVFVGDLLGATMGVMCLLVVCAGALYALGATDRSVRYPTFYPLLLSLTAGLTGTMLTGDLFNLFVFAELLVISSAALTAISDDEGGAEAAFKYFYISLIAAILLLMACGSLYAAYGTLNMADLAERIAADGAQPLRPVAMVLLLVFFLVKGAAVPFHWWQPDFHTAAPTAISALLSSVVVKLGVYGCIRMTTLLFVEQATTIQTVLVVLGVVGVIFGGLAALGTHNVKRMLAYSTLGQMGFILVAIGWGTPLALAAAIVFTVNHSLLKAAMLMLAGALASRGPIKTAAFSNLTGIGKGMPLLGTLFLLGGLGLVGIPPLNGFISKLTLFGSGISAEAYISLALIGVASALSLVYVGRSFQTIFWEPGAPGTKAKPSGDRLWAPTMLIALSVVLGIWAEPLVALADTTSAWLLDPTAYSRAVLQR